MSTHVDPDLRPTTVSHNLDVFWRLQQSSAYANNVATWLSNAWSSNSSNVSGNWQAYLTASNLSNLSFLMNSPYSSFLFNPTELSDLSNITGMLNTSNIKALSNLVNFFTDDWTALTKLAYLLGSPNTAFLFNPSATSSLTALAGSASNILYGSAAGIWASNNMAALSNQGAYGSNALAILTGSMSLSTMSNFAGIFSYNNLSNLMHLLSNYDPNCCKWTSNTLASISNLVSSNGSFLNNLSNLSNLSNLLMSSNTAFLYNNASNLSNLVAFVTSNVYDDCCKWTSNAVASISNLINFNSTSPASASNPASPPPFLNNLSNLSNLSNLLMHSNAAFLYNASNLSNLESLIKNYDPNVCKWTSNALASISNLVSSNGAFLNNLSNLSNLSNLLANSNANYIFSQSNLSNLASILSNLSNYDPGTCKWTSNALSSISNLVTSNGAFLNSLSNLSNLSNLLYNSNASYLFNASNLSNLTGLLTAAATSSNNSCAWTSNALAGLSNLTSSNAAFVFNLSNLSNLSNLLANSNAAYVFNLSNFSNLASLLSNFSSNTNTDATCKWTSNALASISNLTSSNGAFLNSLGSLSNLSNLLYGSNTSVVFNLAALSNLSNLVFSCNFSNITNILSSSNNITNIINNSNASNWNWASNAIASFSNLSNLSGLLNLSNLSNLSNLLNNSNASFLYALNSNNAAALSNLSNLLFSCNFSNVTNIFNTSNINYLLSNANASNWNWASNSIASLASLSNLSELLLGSSNLSSLSNLSNLLNNSNAMLLYGNASNLSNLASLLSNYDPMKCTWTSNAIAGMSNLVYNSNASYIFDLSNLSNLSNLLNGAGALSQLTASNMSNLVSLLSNYDPNCCEWTSNAIASLSNLTSSNTAFIFNLSNLSNLSNLLGASSNVGFLYNASNMSNLASLLSNYDPNCCKWTSNAIASLSNLTSSNAAFVFNLSNLSNLSNLLCNVDAMTIFGNYSNTSNLIGILSNYDPSCCVWSSNILSAISNILPGPSGSNSNLSFILDLSNLALLSNLIGNSNAMDSCEFASNLAIWTSNNFSNIKPPPCALWSFESSNPSLYSNVDTLPRFVYNSNDDSTWYVDCDGVGVPLQGYLSLASNTSNTTASTTSKYVVIAFKSPAELSATSSPSVGDSYIVTTGTGQSDIATWTGTSWAYVSPKNGDGATVTTANGAAYAAGSYVYNATTDLWTFVAALSSASNDGSATSTVIAGNFALLSEEDALVNRIGGPLILVGDQFVAWGDGNIPQSSGDGSSGWGFPRQIPFTYTNLDLDSNAKVATYAPVFVDAAVNNFFILALDSRGKVWGAGIQYAGLGHTQSTTSTSNVEFVPYHGFAPVAFFHGNASITIRKVFTAANQQSSTASFSAALSTTGDLYVTGGNNFGALGLGDVVARTQWVKYPIDNVKNVKVVYLTLLVLTNDGKLYMSGYDPYAVTGGSAGARNTPVLLATNVTSFDYGAYQMNSIYAVKADGTLWVAGINNSGQLGIGNQTNKTGPLVQVSGITNAVSISADKWNGTSAVLLRRDGTISFTGYNDGQFGYAPHVGATYESKFVTPTGIFQGIVKKVVMGARSCHLMTVSGEIFNAGRAVNRGIGRRQNPAPWTINNTWTQVPLSDTAVGFRVYTTQPVENAVTLEDGVLILTDKARFFAYGASIASSWASSMNAFGYSPVYIPLDNLDHGIPVATAPANLVSTAATLTSMSAGTASFNYDGAKATVTFTMPYVAGAIGSLSTTGWTITGTDVVVSAIQNPVFISSTSGTMTFTATVTSASTGLAANATASQSYTVAAGAISAGAAGTRVNDCIVGGLSASATSETVEKYLVADPGTWIEVTKADYSNMCYTVSSNAYESGIYGSTESNMTASSNVGYGAGWTWGNSSNPTFVLPPYHAVYAVAFKPATTSASFKFVPKISSMPTSNYAMLGDVIDTTTVLPTANVNTTKYFVLRGASNFTTSSASNYLGYYDSGAVAGAGPQTNYMHYFPTITGSNLTQASVTFFPAVQYLTTTKNCVTGLSTGLSSFAWNGLSAGTATANQNFRSNTVTFTVPYTGSVGALDTSGWTITGTGVTVTNIKNPVNIDVASGQMTFTAMVLSTNVASLAVGASEPQSYTLSTGASTGATTVTIAGTRINDAIAASLSNNLASFLSASDNTWVEINVSEWIKLKSTIAGTKIAGASDTIMDTSVTNGQTLPNYTFGNASAYTKILANEYPYAFTYFSVSAAAGVQYQPKMSTLPFSGYQDIGAITTTNTVAELRKYFVLKGAKLNSTEDNYVGYYTNSIIKGLTSGTTNWLLGNQTTVSVTSGAGTGAFQMLTTATKQWA